MKTIEGENKSKVTEIKDLKLKTGCLEYDRKKKPSNDQHCKFPKMDFPAKFEKEKVGNLKQKFRGWETKKKKRKGIGLY